MQQHFTIPAWDWVKCTKCLEFKPWDDGNGWYGKHCPDCRREYHRDYMRERRAREDPDERRGERSGSICRQPRTSYQASSGEVLV